MSDREGPLAHFDRESDEHLCGALMGGAEPGSPALEAARLLLDDRKLERQVAAAEKQAQAAVDQAQAAADLTRVTTDLVRVTRGLVVATVILIVVTVGIGLWQGSRTAPTSPPPPVAGPKP